jgi:predicted secreted protein
MNWFSGFAVFFIVWWTVLFAILPLGVRSQAEEGHVTLGSDPGAPAVPNLRRKLIITTAVSAVVYGLIWAIYVKNIFGLSFINDMRL